MVNLDVSPLGWIGSVSDLAKGIIDKIWPPSADPNLKLQAQIAIEQAIQARENMVVDAQKAIIVAEMQQGDSYTKRARPTLVYSGLLFIFLVHVAFPIVVFFTGKPMPTLTLPSDFWWAWGSVVGIWSIGRSVVQRGTSGKIGELANLVSGGK